MMYLLNRVGDRRANRMIRPTVNRQVGKYLTHHGGELEFVSGESSCHANLRMTVMNSHNKMPIGS
jgi:hypothetical protein